MSKRTISIIIIVIIIIIIPSSLILITKAHQINKIKVTGNGNNIFNNEYFGDLVEMQDVFRRLSINDSSKLQSICQALSELELSKSEPIDTDPTHAIVGHSFYQLYYADGSTKLLIVLNNQIILDDSIYTTNYNINQVIQEQFE